MRCHQSQELMNMYAGEEIPAVHRAALEAHLASCPTCRRHQVQLGRLLTLLRRLPPLPPVPERFTHRLMVQARQRLTTQQRMPGGRSGLGPWWDFVRSSHAAGAGAAVAAGLLLGVFMGQQAWHSSANAAASRSEEASANLLGAYEFDWLSGSPRGSFTDAYLSLTSQGEDQET